MIHDCLKLTANFESIKIDPKKNPTWINKGIVLLIELIGKYIHSFRRVKALLYILLVIKKLLLRPTHFLCKDFLISIFNTFSNG